TAPADVDDGAIATVRGNVLVDRQDRDRALVDGEFDAEFGASWIGAGYRTRRDHLDPTSHLRLSCGFECMQTGDIASACCTSGSADLFQQPRIVCRDAPIECSDE